MFTVRTKTFLGMLDDLVTTASSAADEKTYYGVYVTSGRGPWEDEPGDVDLLVGLSANGEVAANTWIDGIGAIDAGFWSLLNVKNIKFVFTPLARTHDKENPDDPHMVTINVDNGFVTIFEENADDPTELQFPVEDSDFPVDGITKWIKGESSQRVPKDERGNEAEDGNLTVWTPALSLVLTVAKRRKQFLRLYRPAHSASIHLAQIGESWRGAIKPFVPAVGSMNTDEPDSDLLI